MATLDESRVLARKAARERAYFHVDLILEDLMAVDREAFREALTKRLIEANLVDLPKPTPYEQQPMANEEARAFGQTTIQFGKHQGERLDDVPLDYLEWLDGQDAQRFAVKLRRYLLSERIRTEAK